MHGAQDGQKFMGIFLLGVALSNGITKLDNFHSYVLKSNKNTLTRYPFEFELYTTYRLDENKLTTIYKVINTGKSNMPFCIGGHPAFQINYDDLVKGDYYFLLKHFDAAIESYKNALDTSDKGNPKIPLILFNCGCAYYFMKNKPKAIEYLNRSISSFSNLKENDKYFGLSENKDKIIKKINVAKSYEEYLLGEGIELYSNNYENFIDNTKVYTDEEKEKLNEMQI